MATFDKNLGKNPTLISVSDLNSLSSTNMVGVDNIKKIFETSKFSFSAKLLNYSEPEIFKGIERTVFYTDVNTEFDKGDKVFILNGNYDSNAYIETNKYDNGSDGYEVLDVDNCRVVLDIKYDSTKLPYTEVDESDVVNIYSIDDKYDLESLTAMESDIYGVKLFDTTQNNVIYYDGEMNHDFQNIFGVTQSGMTYSGPTQSGFYEINGLVWSNIDSYFDSGTGSFLGKKIKIINSNFEYNSFEYKKGFVYLFDSGQWIPSIENMTPIITRSNFRGGKMMGSWNSGVWGKSEEILEWDEPNAEWGGGFLYNANWNVGEINSLDTGIDSYICRLENGVPLEESIEPNNNGFGYNYILSSNIKGGVVNNGNIVNSIVDNNLTDNIVKDYIEGTLSTTASSFIEVNGGLFLESYIEDSILYGSRLNNSRIKNTIVNNSLSINSYFESSVFNNSTYVTDDIIKILGIVDNDTNSGVKGYKLRISEQSYNRLKVGDYFFVKGIIFTDNPKPINFFHKKFKLSTWLERFEYVNSFGNFSNIDLKITSYLSDESTDYFVNILFEKDSVIQYPDINKLDISNAYILDSNFESGLFESSDWNSGFNITDSKNNISNVNGDGKYNLSIQPTGLKIQNPINMIKDEVVFLNSVGHIDTLGISTLLTDTYIVSNPSSKILSELPGSSVLSSLGTTDFFVTGRGLNRNGYLHRLKFKDSNIKTGIFRKSYFNNCLIENKSYKTSDKDFKDLRNIRSLLISDSIFSKTNNFLSSATYLNSLFNGKGDKFIDGIVYNSIWDGNDFNKGVFKESTWVDGIFNGGEFYKNKTFDGNATFDYPNIKDDRINSFYKSGDFPNNRYSWQGGIFNGGLFNKSDWESGEFNNGKFVNSKFYDGTINGGLIGDKGVDYDKTRIYNGVITNTKVENAELFTEDINYNGVNDKEILWENGIFERGIFGSRNIQNEVCFDTEVGNIRKAEDIDYLFISDDNNSYRIEVDNQNNFKYNLQYNNGVKTDYINNIKSVGDSSGNLIELYFHTDILTSPITYYGKVVKYSKNGGILLERDLDSLPSDIYVDSYDNIYICCQTKIEKISNDFKLIWSIDNNVGNVSISGDDDYIYIGGLDGTGYVEKWTSNGDFIWRQSSYLTYNNIHSQKIISLIGTDFILINGFDSTSNKYYIYKINKLDGSSLGEYVTTSSFSYYNIDFAYDYDNGKIVSTSLDRFDIVNVSDMTLFGTASYSPTLPNDRCSHIEYYNNNFYVKNYNIGSPYNTMIHKLRFNYSTLTTFSIVTSGTVNINGITGTSPNQQYTRFTVRNNGIKYSELELIGPTYSNGNLVDGVNTFVVSSVSDIEFEINDVEFIVDKITFNYSVRELGSFNATQSLPYLTFALYQNTNQITITQSISPNEYLTVDDILNPVYIYATDWLNYEEILTGTHIIGDDYSLRINGINSSPNGYEIKVDNFCLHSKEGVMKATWKNGTFNGGEFIEKAHWENGTFNGGLFLSTYGNELITSTQSPTQSFNYAWENGKFNGGEFGNGLIDDNSTWYSGEFNGGVFKGKFWNDGIFTNGKFEGGIDINILGTDITQSYLNTIFNSLDEIDYSSNRGIWRNGYVTTKKDRFIKDKKLYTELKKKDDENKVVSFENVVWNSGTFSHDSGTMDNSIWLDGTFESGTFESSVFNPWRPNNIFNASASCVWDGGLFKGGDFYYSQWNNGLFDTGNAYGMIWNDGISNYMNAYNILWNAGTWKNGNWFGSNFDYNGTTLDTFKTTIMDRINDSITGGEYHIWNVFDDRPLSVGITFSATASNDII